MDKSDKYYLIKGKLELSMLDEEESIEESFGNSEQSELFRNRQFEHTKRIGGTHKKTQQNQQQILKVSKDISNTLHTMGQFLTKVEAQMSSVPSKKNMNASKVKKLEQIASSIKVEEVALPPTMTKENGFNSLNRLEAKPVNLDDRNQEPEEKQRQEVSTERAASCVEEVFTESDEAFMREREIEAQIENSYKEVSLMACSLNEAVMPIEECIKIRDIEMDGNLNGALNKSEESSTLNQNNIDTILASYFKPKEPQYAFTRELKQHIDKHIKAIKEK